MKELELLFENAKATYLGLAQQAPGFRVAETDAYTLVSSSFAHPVDNFAIGLSLDGSSAHELASIAHRNATFRIHNFPTDSPVEVPQLLIAESLEELYAMRLMVFKGEPPSSPAVAREAKPGDLEKVIRFIVANFFWSSPVIIRETMAEIMLGAATRMGTHYLVESGDALVACASLVTTPGAAGIYNVCVRPEERKKGLGGNLVHQLVAEARLQELLPCLQTDPDLESWYIQLGFRTVGSVRVFGAPS
ncbi:MAG: GNAT family N-acetyltransferase [Fimbriimonadales bacterium]